MSDHVRRSADVLARHFFAGLFDLGFLSETGIASLKRIVLGICAAFVSVGLLMVRLYLIKYANLISQDTSQPYRDALLADHAFLIGLPMWIVALVTVLVSHALFPDETDYRVLMGLPVTKRVVFGAKLLAIGRFAGLFTLAAHAALVPLFLLVSLGPWTEWPLVVTAPAFLCGSLLGSAFAVLAVTAVNGLLLAPGLHERLAGASTAVRSAMLFVLVLALPFLMRLPSSAPAIARTKPWIYAVPPIWFLGIERWLLRDTRFTGLAQSGVVAVFLACAVACATYALLYRHFDRVMTGRLQRPPLFGFDRSIRRSSRPVACAIRAFTFTTLRRSGLHQGIAAGLAAIGAGLAANDLVGAWMAAAPRSANALHSGLVESLTWAPFVLVFVGSLAVRTALLVPMEVRANWIFRITEEDGTRAEQLRAAVGAVGRLGVVVPVGLMVPAQWQVMGWDATVVALVALLCGWLLLEVLMRDWARIPFTCSYIPGKGPVPQTFLTTLTAFVVYCAGGTALARFTLQGRSAALVVIAMLCAVGLVLRRVRLTSWRTAPLEFEDQLPSDVNPLRLSSD